MKTLFAVALMIPVMAFAKSPFGGTWKTRVDSMHFSGKPDVYELKNGMYECRSCVPPLKVEADGTDQAVTGHDYYDHISVKVLSPTSVQTTIKKAGKVVSSSTDTVSTDGSKLTSKFTYFGGDKPVTGASAEKRTAPAAAGAHAVSGSWQTESMDLSELMRTVKYESTPHGLKMTWNGQTTDAKFDGKVFDVIAYTAAADGKSISVVDDDPAHGTKTTYILDKQP